MKQHIKQFTQYVHEHVVWSLYVLFWRWKVWSVQNVWFWISGMCYLILGSYLLIGAHTSGMSWSHSVFEWKKAWLAEPIRIPSDISSMPRDNNPGSQKTATNIQTLQYQMHLPNPEKGSNPEWGGSVTADSGSLNSEENSTNTKGNSILHGLLVNPKVNVQEQLWQARLHQERMQTLGFIFWMGGYGIFTLLGTLMLAGMYFEDRQEHLRQVKLRAWGTGSQTIERIYKNAYYVALIDHMILPWVWWVDSMQQVNGKENRWERMHRCAWRLCQWYIRWVYPTSAVVVLGGLGGALWILGAVLHAHTSSWWAMFLLLLSSVILSLSLCFMMLCGMMLLWNRQMQSIDQHKSSVGDYMVRLRNRYGFEQSFHWLRHWHVQYIQRMPHKTLVFLAACICVIAHPNAYMSWHQMIGWLWVPSHSFDASADQVLGVERALNYTVVVLRHVCALLSVWSILGCAWIWMHYKKRVCRQLDGWDMNSGTSKEQTDFAQDWVERFIRHCALPLRYIESVPVGQIEALSKMYGRWVQQRSPAHNYPLSAAKVPLGTLFSWGQWMHAQQCYYWRHTHKTSNGASGCPIRKSAPSKHSGARRL